MDIIGASAAAGLAGLSTSSLDNLLCSLGLKVQYRAPITGTAGAGNQAIAELKNPAASGKTLFGFGGDIVLIGTMGVSIVFDGTSLNPVGVPVPMYDAGPASVAAVGGGNQLAPTGTVFLTRVTTGASAIYLLPAGFWFALPPGKNLQIQALLVATAFTCNLAWLELIA